MYELLLEVYIIFVLKISFNFSLSILKSQLLTAKALFVNVFENSCSEKVQYSLQKYVCWRLF